MKILAFISIFALASFATAAQFPCKPKDFRAIDAALKSRKLQKSTETMKNIEDLKGLLAQETIGVTCKVYVPDMPMATIPGQKIDEYEISDASRAYQVIISTNRVEASNSLSIKRTR